MKKVLIANRGEIAVRIIRACRELGLATVAVYSDADRKMPHVSLADESYPIGPAPSRSSYLAMDKIVAVALRAGADAVHPGYGFLSENAEFADLVRRSGLIFVGPRGDSIRAMGDKTAARMLVRKAGVPTVPGTDGPVSEEDEARRFCDEFGYPVLLKAAAGGGGKGMRIVRSTEDLGGAMRSAQSEAGSAFGDPRVYIEQYIEGPRHIEFQILADQFGNTVHLGDRECSIQRRHQKVVEETPSILLDEQMRRAMGETAIRAAEACRYENAGTIEFLVDPNRKYYFLEMNTRLQVEHPVTELCTGIDIVAAQLTIAAGERLPFTQEQVQFRGHAIECRICAEDVEHDFLPSTGTITHLRPAQGPGVREDRGVEEGGEISVFYDSMISKLVVWGPTRGEAIGRMRRALREYEILGVKTNIPVCAFVLSHPEFVRGHFDTHFLERHFRTASHEGTTEAGLIAAAAVCASLEKSFTALLGGTVISSDGSAAGWKRQRIHLMRS